MSSEAEPLTREKDRGTPSVVLITGCSSGLGKQLALALHACASPKYTVVATARRVDALQDLAAAGVDCVALDVTSDASVAAAVAHILQAHVRVDVLINNAGLSRVGPLVEQNLAEMLEVFETNVLGVVRVTQAAVPAMIRQRRGLVVMVGSVTSQMSTPWAGAYSASKAALLALTDALRLEVKPFGVGVTYVMAGAIRTSFSDNINSSTAFAAYERPGSAYCPWAGDIRARANASQAPTDVMPAEAVAAQVAAVINSWVQGRTPPIWFFAGGKSWLFWALGVVQKTFGWPANGVLARKFGLNEWGR